ncbi:hypothetical protein ACE38W_20305 [Chitinophaga sp. Hz27]|uniref:hypothetical protein n=1 Tax=Chitinophaga sp. Hz27 TaxID=3347169 RepID=UPI0035DC46A8
MQTPSTTEIQLQAELRVYKYLCNVLLLIMATIAVMSIFFAIELKCENANLFDDAVRPIKKGLSAVAQR